jgi:hypothetical protein
MKQKVWAVECPKCHEVIWSRHRHDFRYCKCGAVYVDGGRDYLKRGGDVHPKVLEIEVEV